MDRRIIPKKQQILKLEYKKENKKKKRKPNIIWFNAPYTIKTKIRKTAN